MFLLQVIYLLMLQDRAFAQSNCAEVFSLKSTATYGESVDSLTSYNKYLTSLSKEFLSADLENKMILNVQNRGLGWRRDQLLVFESNALLVVKIARKDFRQGSYFLSEMDYIQAGNEGLIKAIDKYDPSKVNKFSNYAPYWIRERIYLQIEEAARTIRLPVSTVSAIKSFKEKKGELVADLKSKGQVDPLVPDSLVVDALGWKMSRYLDILPYIKYKSDRIGLDTIDGVPVEQYLMAPQKTEASRLFERGQTQKILNSAISELNAEEQMLISNYYGLNGPEKPIREIVEEFYTDVSRETVRKRLFNAVKKLKVKLNIEDRDFKDIALEHRSL